MLVKLYSRSERTAESSLERYSMFQVKYSESSWSRAEALICVRFLRHHMVRMHGGVTNVNFQVWSLMHISFGIEQSG